MSKGKSFVHLHVHGNGSQLDGLALVADLVPEAAKLEMPAIAITDHGSTSATYDLYKATKGGPVKAIYGSEFYVAPDVHRSHKAAVRWAEGGQNDVSGAGAFTHATALAETDEGLHNLFRLSSESYLSGMYRKPRIDTELMEMYHKGIILSTGCPSGEVQTWLRIGDYDKARTAAAKFMEIFGKDNYFVELMDHGLDIEKQVIPDLIRLSKDLGLKTFASNDLHYVRKGDDKVHEALLCIGSGDKLSNPNRFKFDATDFYLKTAEEMRLLWDDVVPEACDNTLLIAERCNATFHEADGLMPKFPIPDGYTEKEWFAREVQKGLERRYPNGIPAESQTRAAYEVGVINQMDFPGYFLVVADFIGWAKEQGIAVGPGRGCLSGDSNVLTPSGFKKIKDVQVGDIVFDERGTQVVVPEAFSYPCEEELILIVAGNGMQGNKMTADHKVLISRSGETMFQSEWVRADEVSVGDYVLHPKRTVFAYVQEYQDIVDKAHYYDDIHGYYRVEETRTVPAEEFVYDFTVPTTSSYVTDSYIVHNSAAGSMVAYALRITELDPIKNELLFERFLNPERISPPDIDIDFDDQRRGEVIEYCRRKYGEDKVVNIGTFMKIKAKAAIKDSTRVLDMPYALGDKLTKVYPPPIQGEDLSLADTYNPDNPRYKEGTEFRAMVQNDPDAKQVLELAKGLEGVVRGHGMHAAGVIMSSKPVMDYVPLMKRDNDAPVMTQFEYPTCEKLGLIKMDFLGLSNLGTITEALRLIKQNRGIDVTTEHIWEDMTDPATFELLAAGETLGVFQLDSAPIRSLLIQMGPDRFNDISAVLALYRPGPMGVNAHTDYAERKNGRQIVAPIHPEFKDSLHNILSDTHNLIVFQEQVMAIAQEVAGYSLGQADLLRKAMGKKDKSIVDAEYPPFKEAAMGKGYSAEAIQALWDTVAPFAAYAFNRCVAGDTVVQLGASGSDTDGLNTIGELYRRLHVNLLPQNSRWNPGIFEGLCLHCQTEDRPAVWRGRCKACKAWIQKFTGITGLSALALDSDGRIRPKRIKDVHYNGKREAFTITLSDGKTITATANHRHMTPDGWKQVDELGIGDTLLITNGTRESVTQRYDYSVSTGKRSYAGSRLPTQERRGVNSVGYIDGGQMKLDEWTRTQVWECSREDCDRSKEKGDRIERAHLNGNRKDNSPENLRMLCASHHKAHDYAQNSRLTRWQAGKMTEEATIVSIEPAGVIDVYDLEMDDPGHNWVGNGIITHNSHSAAYGYISYATAYLKANYPVEYMAALLSTNASNKDKTALYLGECRRMGVQVLVPDVNESFENYNAVGDTIRVGFIAIKGVGHGLIQGLIDTRNDQGKFTGFGDFLSACPAPVLKKNAVEALIKSGAFDSFGYTRSALMLIYEDAVATALAVKKTQRDGQDSLFAGSGVDPGADVVVPDVKEWHKKVLLAFEREMLGLYVSDHPLSGAEGLLAKIAQLPIADVKETQMASGTDIRIAGLITSVERKTTKAKGDPWAILNVEDMGGAIVVNCFPRTYAKFYEALIPDAVVQIDGKLEHQEDGSVKIVGNEVKVLDLEALADPDSVPFVVQVQEGQLTPDLIEELKDTLRMCRGASPLHIRVVLADGGVSVMAVGPEFNVKRGPILVSSLKALLGVDCIV